MSVFLLTNASKQTLDHSFGFTEFYAKHVHIKSELLLQ